MSAGVLSAISFGLESTWGTPVVPNKSIAIRPGDGIQTDTDLQLVSSIKAQLARNASSFKGAQTHEGEYELDFIPGVAGYLIRSALGSVSSAAKIAPNAAVYDHTFSEAETKPSLTVEQAVGDIVRRYAGVIVNSLKFSVSPGEALALTAGMKAKSSASASKITPTYETIRPFNFADLGAAGVSIGGQAYTPRALEVTYNNNHELLHTLGSNDPSHNYAKGSEVSGSFELYLDATSAAEYADYLSKTDNALVITFTGDAIGSSSNYGLQISIPKASYNAATFPVTDEYNMLSVEFDGIYDTATSKLLTIVLTNLLTTYAS
jgi:hypothetical protein